MPFHGQLVIGTGESRAAPAGPMNVADGNALRGHSQQALQHISQKPAGMLKQTAISGRAKMTQGVVIQQVATIRLVANQGVASTVDCVEWRRDVMDISNWVETV